MHLVSLIVATFLVLGYDCDLVSGTRFKTISNSLTPSRQIRKCDNPTLENGFTTLRSRGRLMRFSCKKDYKLIGNVFSECSRGRWSTEVPVCIKSGCELLQKIDNSIIQYDNQNAIARLFCDVNYTVAGNSVSYCNGFKWDRSLGYCRETHTGHPLFCDFEVDDLCNWTNDLSAEYLWKRRSGVTAFKLLRSGPRHDHTTMKALDGYYVIIEPSASDQLVDDNARLISPIYSANLTQSGCFRFYYHMYGRTVGFLKVYVKPVDVDMEQMLWDNKYVYFQVNGSQRNLWHEGYFPFKQMQEDFQIVFEASATSSHFGNIAIDDVAILSEDECMADKVMTTTMANEDVSGVVDVQSCVNRCDEQGPDNTNNNYYTKPMSFITNGSGIILKCNCYMGCADDDTCCWDHKIVCFNEQQTVPMMSSTIEANETVEDYTTTAAIVRPTTPSSTTTITTTSRTTPTTTLTTTRTTTTTTRTTPTTPTTTSTTTTTTRTTPTTSTTTRTTPTTPTTTRTTPSTTRTTPSTTRSTPSTTRTTQSTTVKTTQKLTTPFTISTTTTSTRKPTRRTTITTTSARTTPTTRSTRRSTTTSSTTTRASTKTTARTKPTPKTTTRRYSTTTKSTSDNRNSKQDKKKHKRNSKLIILIMIVSISLFIIASVFIYKTYCTRCQSGRSQGYYSKYRRAKSKLFSVSATQNCNNEFSEVRFLTADDEHFDFPLSAQPSDRHKSSSTWLLGSLNVRSAGAD